MRNKPLLWLKFAWFVNSQQIKSTIILVLELGQLDSKGKIWRKELSMSIDVTKWIRLEDHIQKFFVVKYNSDTIFP